MTPRPPTARARTGRHLPRARTRPAPRGRGRVGVLTAAEHAQLEWAYGQLEHPSFAARLSNMIGTPLERIAGLMPRAWNKVVQRAAQASLLRALDLALATLPRSAASGPSILGHRLLAGAGGAAGGFLGAFGLVAELPVVTVLMLRAIGGIARTEGEDLSTLESRLACVEVFGLGGRSHQDDAADTGYYGLRIALGLHFYGVLDTQAAGRIGIPLAVNALRGVSARFGVVVSDKLAAQLVPVAGALAGAAVNMAFMHHFQDVARGHFIVRRLERAHGPEAIRVAYEEVASREAVAAREFSSLEGW